MLKLRCRIKASKSYSITCMLTVAKYRPVADPVGSFGGLSTPLALMTSLKNESIELAINALDS